MVVLAKAKKRSKRKKKSYGEEISVKNLPLFYKEYTCSKCRTIVPLIGKEKCACPKVQNTNRFGAGFHRFGARRVIVGDISFGSLFEALRYSQLKWKQEVSREISGLKLQPKVPLRIGEKVLCNYVADFYYLENLTEEIIEDAKGMKTDIWKLKFQLAQILYPGTKFRITVR
jgi:hypothetical protein